MAEGGGGCLWKTISSPHLVAPLSVFFLLSLTAVKEQRQPDTQTCLIFMIWDRGAPCSIGAGENSQQSQSAEEPLGWWSFATKHCIPPNGPMLFCKLDSEWGSAWSGLWQRSLFLCFVGPGPQYHLYGSAYICSLCWAIWAALLLWKRPLVSRLGFYTWHPTHSVIFFYCKMDLLLPSALDQNFFCQNQMAANKLCQTSFVINLT